jgi:hypothetical protein
MNGTIVPWEMGRAKPAAWRQACKRRLEKPAINPAACCNSAHANMSWYKPVQVSTSEYHQRIKKPHE